MAVCMAVAERMPSQSGSTILKKGLPVSSLLLRCLAIEDNTVHVDPMVAEQSQKAKAQERQGTDCP